MSPKTKIQSKKHIARLERERRQVRIIQIVAICVVAAVILVLAYGYLDINYFQPRQPIAEVNGEKITTKEFQARVVLQRNDLLNTYMQYLQFQQFGMDITAQLQELERTLSDPGIVGEQVLDQMISEILIRQEAERRGISVSADELEEFTRGQYGFYPDGSPTPSATPTVADITYPTLSPEQLEFVTLTPTPTQGPTVTPPPTATVDPALTPTATSMPEPTPLPAPTATPYTLEGYQERFDEVLTGMKDIGLTEAQYRGLFENELLRTKLIEAVTTDLPTEEEQVWARHILVPDAALANLVIERLNAGEDFGELAKELSQDPGSAEAGGDLGWFGKGVMVTPFEEAAFSLDIGEISEPVQSDFGWHIIQTLGHTTLPISESAYQQARRSAFEEFIAKLRDEAEIVIQDNWLERVPESPGLQDLQF